MKNIRRGTWFIIVALVVALFCGTVSAADGSDYAIIFDETGIISSFDRLDSNNHTISARATMPNSPTAASVEQVVPKTYFFKYTEASFSLTNKTGVVILPLNIFKVDNFDQGVLINFLNTSPNWSKSADALSSAKASRSTLESFGYSLDSKATDFYYLYFTNAGTPGSYKELNFAVLIEITPDGTEPPKPLNFDELNEQLARVSDEKKSDWNTVNDRYNGTDYSKVGFWADLTKENGPLANAKKALNAAAQEEIDIACADLKAAISKLIPSTRANTTLLYEELLNTPSKDDYTPKSWAAYSSLRSEAEAMMASMFDKDGNPTEANSSDKQQALEDLAARLAAARKALDERAGAVGKER